MLVKEDRSFILVAGYRSVILVAGYRSVMFVAGYRSFIHVVAAFFACGLQFSVAEVRFRVASASLRSGGPLSCSQANSHSQARPIPLDYAADSS